MSSRNLTPADVEWPDEREPYKPRHRSDVGRTHPWSSEWPTPTRQTGRHDKRNAAREALQDWIDRHSLRDLLTLTGHHATEALR
jgi:hypothetical protein